MDDSDQTFAVHVRGVSKEFKTGSSSVHALREVDFDARFGELLMIVGPSGCGKTTLLSVIAGTLRFDSGEIDVFGESLHSMNDKEITNFRKKNVGFIFQQYHLIDTLTSAENVGIPLILNGYDRNEAIIKAGEELAKVGLGGREKEKPSNFSGGQQQRVAIARALIHQPRLVICDEPTAALDAENGAKIMELLCEIARNPSRTVIVVTHDSRIFKYANRVVQMDDGKIKGVLNNHNEIRTL